MTPGNAASASTDSGRKVTLRIRRQDGPGKPSRWEEFVVPHRPQMNVISCLQAIAAKPVTTEGKQTTPPVPQPADVWRPACQRRLHEAYSIRRSTTLQLASLSNRCTIVHCSSVPAADLCFPGKNPQNAKCTIDLRGRLGPRRDGGHVLASSPNQLTFSCSDSSVCCCSNSAKIA